MNVAKRFVLVPLIAALAVLGCSKDKKSPTDSKWKGEESPPSSDTGSLWSYAPDGMVVGFVVADGAFKTTHSLVQEIKRILGATPGGKMALAEMSKEMMKEPGFDIFDAAELEKRGFDLSKGAALFMKPNQQKVDQSEMPGAPFSMVLIVPIKDRKAFLKLVGDDYETKTIDGTEYDVMDGDDAYCQMKEGRYICATSRELLAAAWKKGGSALSKQAAALPTWARGDAELIVDMKQIPEAQSELREIAQFFSNISTASLALRFEKGEVSVRGHAVGDMESKLESSLANIPQSSSLTSVVANPVSMVRFRLPMDILGPLWLGQMPASAPVAGIDVVKDLVMQYTGEIALVTGGEGFFGGGMALGMKNTEALAKALPQLCAMSQNAPGLKMSHQGNRCEGTMDFRSVIPPGSEPMVEKFFPGEIPLSIEVRPDAIIGRMGAKDGKDDATDIGVTKGNQRILKSKQVFAGLHTWTDPFATGPFSIADITKNIPDVPREFALFAPVARSLAAHIYSIGYSFGPTDKGVGFEARVTTYATDGDEAYRAYSDAAIKLATTDDGAAYKNAVAELAAKHSGGTLAKLNQYLDKGAPVVGMWASMTAAIAIPAFMKYIKKSKTTEASQFVKKLYDGARASYMERNGRETMSQATAEAKFPEPSAGPTPPLGSCCKSGGKCMPDAKLWDKEPWRSLYFSVDDPHYYSYEYKVNNKGKNKSFTVSAYGDLDCDGVYSTFTMQGVINEQYSDGPSGTAAIYRNNELE